MVTCELRTQSRINSFARSNEDTLYARGIPGILVRAARIATISCLRKTQQAKQTKTAKDVSDQASRVFQITRRMPPIFGIIPCDL